MDIGGWGRGVRSDKVKFTHNLYHGNTTNRFLILRSYGISLGELTSMNRMVTPIIPTMVAKVTVGP